jgi:hypothetical protein
VTIFKQISRLGFLPLQIFKYSTNHESGRR